MTQTYFDPAQADAPYSLPDCEIWYSEGVIDKESEEILAPGWYWWACFPGCLPDSDPMGPFDSYLEALIDARQDSWQYENSDDHLVVWYSWLSGDLGGGFHRREYSEDIPAAVLIDAYIVTFDDARESELRDWFNGQDHSKPIHYAY